MRSADVVRLLMPLALLTTGLSAGGLLVAMVGSAPMRLALPFGQAVRVHNLLLSGLDRIMPACLITATVSTATVGFFMPTVHSEVLCIVASSFALKAVLISAVKLAPINRRLAALDETALRVGVADDPRERWRNWNTARAWSVIVALVLNVTNVGFLL